MQPLQVSSPDQMQREKESYFMSEELKIIERMKVWFKSMELDNQERKKNAEYDATKAYFDGFIQALQLGINHLELLEKIYSEEVK